MPEEEVKQLLNAEIMPRVDFEDTILKEGLDFFKIAMVDGGTLSPARRIPAVIIDAELRGRRLVNLKVRQVSLWYIYQALAEQSGAAISIKNGTVEFRANSEKSPSNGVTHIS